MGNDTFRFLMMGGSFLKKTRIFLYVAYGILPLEWKDNEVLARYGGAKPVRVVAETDD